jgi:hypothetical protein
VPPHNGKDPSQGSVEILRQGSALYGVRGQRASLCNVPQEEKIDEWPPPDENDDAF